MSVFAAGVNDANASINTSTTVFAYGAGRIKVVSKNFTDATKYVQLFQLDATAFALNTAATSRYAALRFYGNGDVAIALYPSGGTLQVSGPIGTYTVGEVNLWELEVKRLANGNWQATVKKDGTTLGSFENTAGGTGMNLWRVVVGAQTHNLETADTITYRSDLVFMNDNSGSLANSWFSSLGTVTPDILLPDGDVAGETQWFTQNGAPGTYTTWDDAPGLWNTTDYNKTTTAAGEKIQSSTLTNLTRSGTILGVGLYVSATTLTLLTLAVRESGTSTSFTSVAYGQSVGMAHWATKPTGGDWTDTAVNGLDARARRADSTTNVRIYALWAIAWIASAEATPVNVTDTLNVSAGETASVVVRVSVTDTLNVSVGDVIASRTQTTTDTLGVAVSEALKLAQTATDTLNVSLSETASTAIAITVTDTLNVAVAEAATKGVTVADTVAVAVTEASSVFVVPLHETLILALEGIYAAAIPLAGEHRQNIGLRAEYDPAMEV